jgi:glycosyltransferase involved in cell wall biosynthesis
MLALILADSGEFTVHLAFGNESGIKVSIPDRISSHPNIRLIPYTYEGADAAPSGSVVRTSPSFEEIVSRANPQCYIGLVSSYSNGIICNLPREIPQILISPFGHVCSNGNLRKLYVSGAANTKALLAKGVDMAQVFYNPLPIPPFNEEKAHGRDPSSVIVFGRTGRVDAPFDPISFRAFSRLEKEYGDKVKYIYVNPNEEARQMSKHLGLKRVEFREWLSEEELKAFYREIDVFAHARLDGETLGVAIAEAMLNQCPIVSHKSFVHDEHLTLLNGSYGWVAEICDSDGYYQGMKYFIENRDRIPEFGKAARDFAVSTFDKDIIGVQFLEQVREVVKYYGSYGVRLPDPRWLKWTQWISDRVKIRLRRLKGFKVRTLILLKDAIARV